MLEFGPELEIKLKKDKNLSDGQQYALGQRWQMAISLGSSFPILSHRMTKRLTSPCNTVVRLLFLGCRDFVHSILKALSASFDYSLYFR